MNPRVTKILWTAAALLLLAPLAGCKGKAADPKTATAAVVLTVQAAPAAEGTVLDTVEVLGEFQGREEIRVFATVPDRIRELLVKEGDRVKAGDVLLTVWNDLQGGAVAQAQAGQAAASVGAKAAHDNLVRMRKLAADGVIPPAQLEAAEAQANAAAAQVRAASTGVGMAGLQKDRTVVRAPIDGVVTSLAVKAGDMAGAGMPLLTLVQPDRLKAVLKVPERSFLKLTPRDAGDAEPRGPPRPDARGAGDAEGTDCRPHDQDRPDRSGIRQRRRQVRAGQHGACGVRAGAA